MAERLISVCVDTISRGFEIPSSPRKPSNPGQDDRPAGMVPQVGRGRAARMAGAENLGAEEDVRSMDTIVTDYLDVLISDFFDPNRRIYLGYLIPTFAMAAVVILIGAGWKLRAAVAAGRRALFNRSIWWSESARGDYKALAVNHAFMMAVGPRLVPWLAVAAAIYTGLETLFDARPGVLALSTWLVTPIFTVCYVLCDDISKYLVHRAFHRWPLLWAFHKVHHTAEVLNPLTIYRFHPVELVLSALRSIAVYAAVISLFFFFFSDTVSLYTVLGVNTVMFVFNATGANLRHTHVRLTYGPIFERIFISPAQHQIHHSVEKRHHDKNFGAILALWDWLGGSLCLADKAEDLRYGVTGGTGIESNSLYALYVKPVLEAGQIMRNAAARGGRRS